MEAGEACIEGVNRGCEWKAPQLLPITHLQQRLRLTHADRAAPVQVSDLKQPRGTRRQGGPIAAAVAVAAVAVAVAVAVGRGGRQVRLLCEGVPAI